MKQKHVLIVRDFCNVLRLSADPNAETCPEVTDADELLAALEALQREHASLKALLQRVSDSGGFWAPSDRDRARELLGAINA